MPRITTRETALRFLLENAVALQNNGERFSADDWYSLADDLRAVATYADERGKTLDPAMQPDAGDMGDTDR